MSLETLKKQIKYSFAMYDAAMLQGLTLGRLPSLSVGADPLCIVWNPPGPNIPILPFDLSFIYQSILFHAADSPLPLRDVIFCANEIASGALSIGIDVDGD